MTFKDYTIELKKSYIEASIVLVEHLKEFGVKPHLGFGSLLGAVRGDGLIDSDSDIDLCYLSNYKSPKDVVSECQSLYEFLKSKGILLKYWDINYAVADVNKPIVPPFGQAHIKINGHIIDLFTAWADKYGIYNTCQWGRLSYHTGFERSTLLGYNFTIPSNYDEILTALYGDWRTPRKDHPSRFIKRDCYLKKFIQDGL
jgi:phosphorylcholine metabolism protein LicD